MKIKQLISVLIVPLVSLSLVCFAEINTHAKVHDVAKASSLSQEDSKIATWLIVLNQNEILAAKIALSHTQNQNVKKYAKMMIKDHTKNLKDTQILMKNNNQKIIVTSEIKSLRAMGTKEASQLKILKDKQFDIAYINAMINGHNEALQILDQDIAQLPNHSPMKKHLENTRQAVNAHLEKAKEISHAR